MMKAGVMMSMLYFIKPIVLRELCEYRHRAVQDLEVFWFVMESQKKEQPKKKRGERVEQEVFEGGSEVPSGPRFRSVSL